MSGGGGSAGGASGGASTPVNQYKMSLHYGFCIEVDMFCGLYCQNKTVWEGAMGSSGMININQPTLWSAGEWDVTAQAAQSAGGPVGNMYVLLGGSDQVAPTPLANNLGYDSTTCPGFRGFFSLYFCSDDNDSGFLWINNVPDVPGVQARVWREPKAPAVGGNSLIPAQGFAADRTVGEGWNDDRYDQQGNPITDDSSGPTYGPSIPDANPAFILYEILTNGSWGMGLDPSLIDATTFTDAGYTLYGEQLGLSYKWTSQDSIESMTSEVLSTIQGVMYVSPETGLFTLKLIRNDYTVSDLLVMNQTNGKITSFTRRLLGETHNVVSVTWTNPLTESNDTSMAFDPGGISRQGGAIVQSTSYPGVRNEILALQLAMRDLTSAAAPLATIEMEVDRSFWGTSPGDCIVVNYPEYGISGMVCRVIKVDYGKPGASAIKLNVTEDIFSARYASYQTAVTSKWNYPPNSIVPVTNALVTDLPYYAVCQILDGSTAKSRVYPESTVAIFAQAPASNTSVFQVYADTTDILGNTTVSEVGSKSFMTYGTLSAALVEESVSSSVALGVTTKASWFLILGTLESEQEICVVSATSGSTVTLWRGMLDTTPKAWAAGTPFFVAPNPALMADSTAHAAGSPVQFQLCPMVQGRVLKVTSAPIVTGNPVGRQHLPTRPANLSVGGVQFGTYTQTTTADIAVTWARRNRLTEDLTVLSWTANDVTPESGQTTTLKLWTIDLATLLWSQSGIAGTSGTVPYSAFGGVPSGYIQACAENGDLESLQGHMVKAQVPATGGYGEIYGYKYGEA